jgi:hypothetical protein
MSNRTHINYLAQGSALPSKINRFRKGSIKSAEDPVYLTFFMDFDPATSETSHPAGDPFRFNSLLMDMDATQYPWDITKVPEALEISAIEYLSRLENTKPSDLTGLVDNIKSSADLLRQFQVILNNTYSAAPWYFQSITGISELWKIATSTTDVNKKITLTVNCQESVDLRILQMADYYRKAVYNTETRSHKLPENLRMFSFDLYLFEIRNLKDFSTFSKRTSEFTNGNHYVKFKCKMCEFDFSETLAGGNTPIDVKAYTEDKPFNTSFKIHVNWVREDSEYQSIDLIKLDGASPNFGILSGAVDSLVNQGRRQLANLSRIPARVIGAVVNEIQSTVTNLALGNAYSGQRRDIIDINSATQSIGQVFEGPGGRVSPRGPAPTDRDELGRRSG